MRNFSLSSKEDYDVINEFEVKDGSAEVFNVLRVLTGLSNLSQYDKLRRYLDVTELIDYLLLNYYSGNHDVGEHKNWYAIRRRAPAGVFQYLMWDGEQALHSVRDDTVNRPFERPFRLAEELALNAEYRLAFADRVQKHFFNDGALTPQAAGARWLKRAHEVDLAMIAESARWGYYRRNPPFTRDKEWLAEQQRLLRHYFPARTRIVLEQLRSAGLYPNISVPAFNHQGGDVPEGFKLSLTSESGGNIHYTTDGTDPRMYGTGVVSPDAQTYAQPVLLRHSVRVKTRVQKDGIWSALSEATFVVAASGAVP